MKNFKRWMLAAPLAALLAAQGAQAAEPQAEGVYVGIGLGNAHARGDINDLNASMNLGYQINAQFGAELFYSSLPTFSSAFNNMFGGDEVKPDGHWGLGLVGRHALNQDWTLFGRLGLGRTGYSNNRSDAKKGPVVNDQRTEASLAGGLSYAVSSNWHAGVEAAYFQRTKVSTLSAVLVYRF